MGGEAATAAQMKQGESLQNGLLSTLEVAQAEVTPATSTQVPTPATPSHIPAAPEPQPTPIPTPTDTKPSNPQEGEKIIVVKKEQ